jgi:hypothetical protein
MLNAFPEPQRLYVGRSEGGAMIEGRKDNNSGNTMKPGALTRYHKIDNFAVTEASEDWAKHPLRQYEYDVEVRSFIPHSAIINLDSLNDDIKRLETLSFWHASFQEIERHLGLAEKIKETDFWNEISSVVNEFKEDIK